jgi:hypothetical protein
VYDILAGAEEWLEQFSTKGVGVTLQHD